MLITRTAVAGLAPSLDGHVITPEDVGYDESRQAFNLSIDLRPAAVVIAHSAQDVAATVRFARARGLRVAPQGTGHNAAPLGSLDDVILLRTGAMKEVDIDFGAGQARVEAGVVWGEVADLAAPVGLAALAGSSRNVGVVGYTLGGGLGWLARKHGLACNSVTAIELVTGEGEQVRVDADHDPELFWALRGGGGNFGVVTALEFRLYPVSQLYAGALFFPIERAGEVLHAWNGWTAEVPDEITSVGRILQVPPMPDVPEVLRGGAFAVVEAACLLDEAAGAEALAPLRELGPEIDTFSMVDSSALGYLHMDPDGPVPAALSGHQLLGELPAAAIDEVVRLAGPGSGSPLLSYELRHTGGEAGRGTPGNGALPCLRGTFCSFAIGVPDGPETARAIGERTAALNEALSAHDAGRYLNFVEEAAGAAPAFWPSTLEQLRAVAERVDPDGLIVANHPVR